MKKIIRLTEQDLARIVRRVINEADKKVPGCVKGDCKNGYGEMNVTDYSYKGHFKNEGFDGYGVLKFKTGGIYKGHFSGTNTTDALYGKFTNKHGRVFTGLWDDLASGMSNLRYRVPAEKENKNYGLFTLKKLENIKKEQTFNTQNCKKPTANDYWIRSSFDKNYEYYNPMESEEHSCWWARNINTGKIFNLTDLAKTNPKIQKSIDILNKEYLNKYGLKKL